MSNIRSQMPNTSRQVHHEGYLACMLGRNIKKNPYLLYAAQNSAADILAQIWAEGYAMCATAQTYKEFKTTYMVYLGDYDNPTFAVLYDVSDFNCMMALMSAKSPMYKVMTIKMPVVK